MVRVWSGATFLAQEEALVVVSRLDSKRTKIGIPRQKQKFGKTAQVPPGPSLLGRPVV